MKITIPEQSFDLSEEGYLRIRLDVSQEAAPEAVEEAPVAEVPVNTEEVPAEAPVETSAETPAIEEVAA